MEHTMAHPWDSKLAAAAAPPCCTPQPCTTHGPDVLQDFNQSPLCPCVFASPLTHMHVGNPSCTLTQKRKHRLLLRRRPTQ